MNKHKAYMYRQGQGWIAGTWDESVKCYRLSRELPYFTARAAVGEANCPHKSDGKCQAPSHQHLKLR